MLNQQSFKHKSAKHAAGQHHANQPSSSSINKSINASAISQGSSTLGGPADKYRQAFLIDKPAARREQLKEKESEVLQLEKELRTQKQRYRNLEDMARQLKKDLDETRHLMKKEDREHRSTIEDMDRQLDE